MNNQIALYTNTELNCTLEVINHDGELLFIAKDVCDILDIGNSRQAISSLDEDEKGVISKDTPGGIQRVSVITESGLYSLILRSRKPEARRFKRWVTREILPAIRRTGGYIQTAPEDTPEAIMARALLIATDTLARQKQHIASLEHKAALEAPKTRFAELVADSESTILIGEFAKILRQNGADIGQNRLFTMLRNDGYLGRRGENKNLPTQKAMELGLFRIQKHVYTNSRGESIVKRTAKLTGKGQIYFAGKYATHHAPQTA